MPAPTIEDAIEALRRLTTQRQQELWQRKPGSIVLPGHDLPMQLAAGVPQFIGKREAAMSSWLGDDMETTTLFTLTQ